MNAGKDIEEKRRFGSTQKNEIKFRKGIEKKGKERNDARKGIEEKRKE